MHLPVTSKHGFHDYEIKADAIKAAQARSGEASQGRERFLDTEPYFLGPSQVGALGDTGSGQSPQWAHGGSLPARGTQRAVYKQAACTGGK